MVFSATICFTVQLITSHKTQGSGLNKIPLWCPRLLEIDCLGSQNFPNLFELIITVVTQIPLSILMQNWPPLLPENYSLFIFFLAEHDIVSTPTLREQCFPRHTQFSPYLYFGWYLHLVVGVAWVVWVSWKVVSINQFIHLYLFFKYHMVWHFHRLLENIEQIGQIWSRLNNHPRKWRK